MLSVDKIMVLDLNEIKGVDESLGKKRTISTTRKLKAKNEEFIKEDIQAVVEKINEKKKEGCPSGYGKDQE